ncbi:RidA family protein [Azospirillum agricola]|uniref:RidA family protein n=1 Tax=Azospirillum agricola TaxID=1720247 RepID=UPI000A0EF587|nr:RidA family protein [Azospirillum agricola]SMH59102.1 Enamine deaminase RidA, house cleaning of reactive enamine intermediates, YjgF/YER057c/UK114 family [Azospirillum lipoferum]
MTGRIDARLAELGIELPQAAAPVAAYVAHTRSGNTLYISGQITVWNGERRFLGKVGQDFTVEQGKEAARLCALNILAQAKAALDGDLDRVTRVLKLGGFVNSGADFHDHPAVINGASELMQEVFGDAGRHARAAVGAPSLPGNVAVEVEAVLEVA